MIGNIWGNYPQDKGLYDRSISQNKEKFPIITQALRLAKARSIKYQMQRDESFLILSTTNQPKKKENFQNIWYWDFNKPSYILFS